MKTLQTMRTKALTVHFVHQAEVAILWDDENEARAFATDPERKQYNTQFFIWIPEFCAFALQDAEPEF